MAKAENEVQRACMHLLKMLRIPHWRSNQIPVYDRKRGDYRAFVGEKGVSDICAVLPPIRHAVGAPTGGGQFLGIECKSDTGKQSPEQKAWQEEIEDVGGWYVVAHRVGDLIDFLRHKGVMQ